MLVSLKAKNKPVLNLAATGLGLLKFRRQLVDEWFGVSPHQFEEETG
jgi:hypothetical protein